MAITYVDALAVAIDLVNDEEVKSKLEALSAQISKKHSSSGNSKAKREADANAEKVFLALSEMDEAVTITELQKLTSDEEVASWSNQRISALLRKLGSRVVKEMRGKKAYFSVA